MRHAPCSIVKLLFTCFLVEFMHARGLATTKQLSTVKAEDASSVSAAAGVSRWLGVAGDDASSADVENWLWLIGIGCTLLGASGKSCGLLIQKFSHQDALKTSKQVFWTPRWTCGLVMWVLGNCACWFGQGLADQCLLACFNCWSIVVVFVLAPALLGENIQPQGLTGAALMLPGFVLVAVAGPKEYTAHKVALLRTGWKEPAFLIVTAINVVGVLLAAMIYAIRRRQSSSWRPSALQYIAVTGVFAWYSVICSKSAVWIIAEWLQGGSEYGDASLFIKLLIGLIFTMGCNIFLLNKALESADAIFVLPLYEALSMIGQTVVVGIFFAEFQTFTLRDHINFWGSLMCVVGGAVITASGSSSIPANPPRTHRADDVTAR